VNRRQTTFLLVLNLALVVVLAWLWLSPAGQRNTHWTAPSPVVPQLGAGSAATPSGQQADGARLAAVLERPVFAVTRRPLSPTRVAAAAPVAPPADPLDGVHIFGMFGGAEGGGLIVRADGKVRRVKVSEAVGDWRLKEIRGGDAVFVRAGQTRVVSLVQGKKAGGAAAATPGAPPALPGGAVPAPVPPSANPPAVAAPVPPRIAAPAPSTPSSAGSPAARPPGAPSSPFVIGGSR
jgi:hypothetical protein